MIKIRCVKCRRGAYNESRNPGDRVVYRTICRECRADNPERSDAAAEIKDRLFQPKKKLYVVRQPVPAGTVSED